MSDTTTTLPGWVPALERLLSIARHDTGQSCRVANFLLASWNAEECGGFDFTELWGVGDPVAEDISL
ncbi:hypothetical protein U0O11_09380 [Cobetia sp. D5]|uniref:DUF7673 family protein n=1 Tax=Cobetia sp. D5 TaxID=3105867 RepID=UPI002D7A0B5C|nr:hypothetical protein [Cobetia sp. D5]